MIFFLGLGRGGGGRRGDGVDCLGRAGPDRRVRGRPGEAAEAEVERGLRAAIARGRADARSGRGRRGALSRVGDDVGGEAVEAERGEGGEHGAW